MVKYLLCIGSFIAIGFYSCKQKADKDLIRYVDPIIGTSYTIPENENKVLSREDYGQVIPAVTSPFGMTQWIPQTNSGEQECTAPFYSSISYIQGFRASHWLSGSCMKDYGSFTFMPVNNISRVVPMLRRSFYELTTVTSTPSYFSVLLPESNIMTEITATKRAGFFRFSWAFPENPHILVDVNSDEGQGFIKVDAEKNEIYGYNPVSRNDNMKSQPNGFGGYFVARFNVPITKYGILTGQEYFDGKTEDSDKKGLGAYAGFNLSENAVVLMKVGTSFTSIENARKNLYAEIPGWDFNQTENELNQTWNKLLETIEVEGGEEEDFKKFYTAIYHSCMQPRLFSDADGSFVGFDGDSTIYKAEGFDYYCDFSASDIFMAQMPLVSLIAPKQYEDMVHSLTLKAEQSGWIPTFTFQNRNKSALVGDHISTIIGDAFLKGFDAGIKKVWPTMLKNAYESSKTMEDSVDGKGRHNIEPYLKYGYIPLEEEVNDAICQKGQVSQTLEYAFDDWVLAQVAKKLGYEKEYKDLSIRSENYANVYDPDKGWVCGRFADGRFSNDFSETNKMSYLSVGTPKHYSFYAPQNIPGLIETMGGSEIFKKKLNNLFDNTNFWQGSEPCKFIPYLFNYVGEWQTTQDLVKNILKTQYGISNYNGFTGNENAGQLSAWYVFSAMGFYPVCPGSNEFQLSSPIFDKVVLRPDKKYSKGKTFIIKGQTANRYKAYNEVKLNGKKTGPVLLYENLKKGGKLEFFLTNQ